MGSLYQRHKNIEEFGMRVGQRWEIEGANIFGDD